MEIKELPQLHNIQVVSARTSLSRSALYRVIKSGELKAVKIGKSTRFTEEDLCAFINNLPSPSMVNKVK